MYTAKCTCFFAKCTVHTTPALYIMNMYSCVLASTHSKNKIKKMLNRNSTFVANFFHPGPPP